MYILGLGICEKLSVKTIVIVGKNHKFRNLVVCRLSKDPFFRISHTKLGYLAKYGPIWTWFGQHFWIIRSVTLKMGSILFFSKKVSNHVQMTQNLVLRSETMLATILY